MKLAYADPPYIGQAKRHYGSPEVDHHRLIDQLVKFDGWALSCSSPTVAELMLYAQKVESRQVRMAAWVKPFAVFKPNVNPAYAWEPVLFVPARKRSRTSRTVRDWVSVNITLKTGLVGVKPKPFCFWIFDLLAADPSDIFCDLFPGSGVFTECWQERAAGGIGEGEDATE